MAIRSTNSEIKSIPGGTIGLPWLSEIASVYSSSALHMDWHRHPDGEIICCVKGEMAYEFRNHRPITLCNGEFLVIPAKTEHRLTSGIDAPSRRVSFLFKSKRTKPFLFSIFTGSAYRALLSRLSASGFKPKRFSASTRDTIVRLGHFLHRTPQRLTDIDKCEIRILICSLLVDCARGNGAIMSKPEVKMMDEATAWLEKHFSEQVSIPLLVEHMGYGRTRFFSLFKQKTGLSPNDYLIRLRIKKAKELLQSGTLPIGDIAKHVGFTNSTFFSTTFKRLVGASPSEFRAPKERG